MGSEQTQKKCRRVIKRGGIAQARARQGGALVFESYGVGTVAIVCRIRLAIL